ncbi:MAG TPA: hypothetical protein DCY12_02065 [Candidatus Atribacteria bacterium]|nr:hypothetical protein [Candidatus Atribacteria bacterium]
MKTTTLHDLQVSVQDKSAFTQLGDYLKISQAFLCYFQVSKPTRIISPSHTNYIFYQYCKTDGYKITRPLNSNLFIESDKEIKNKFERFVLFLSDLKILQDKIINNKKYKKYIESQEIDQVIYTLQQTIGCIGDSFDNSNQSRKRIGMLFEVLVKLIIKELGMECEPRTVILPIPNQPGYSMSYELDLVLSKNKAIITSETKYINPSEVVASVKTTSKDRIDKIFFDKFLLSKLLSRDIKVFAIFLHDVQRAKKGNSIFGINSTFKTNHFLGYTVALNKLDGVYYVDPRPEMTSNPKLKEQIKDFQKFLTIDLWNLTKK